MRNLQRFNRALLLPFAIFALAVPTTVLAADCPAGDYPSLVTCAGAALSGDTITLSADITATGSPPLTVPNDVTLVNAGFQLQGMLLKTGPGRLTLNAANSLTGLTLQQGTLAVSVASAINSATISMTGGKLLSTGLLFITPPAISFDSGSSILAATSSSSLGVGGSVVTLMAGTTVVFGDPPDNGPTSLAPSNLSSADPTSAMFVNGNSTFAGSTTFSNLSGQTGSFTVDNVGGFSTNGNTVTIGNLQGPTRFASVTVAGAPPVNPLTILSGSFQGGFGGNGPLVKNGPGTLVAAGLIQHTGGTTISGGTLQLGDGSGTNQNYILDITNNATLVVDTAAANFTLNGSVTGSGNVVKNGVGNFNLNAIGTYDGGTTVNNGNLTVPGVSALGTGLVSLANSGRLVVTGNTPFTLPIDFASGGSPFLCAGGGTTVTFTGTFSGSPNTLGLNGCFPGATIDLANLTTVTAGTTQVTNADVRVSPNFGGTLFSSAQLVRVSSGATLTLDNPAPTQIPLITGGGNIVIQQGQLRIGGGTFDGVISGPGSLATYSTPQQVILTGDNTYSGTTDIGAFTRVGAGGTSGSLGTGPINNNALLTFDRTDGLDIPNTLSGGSIEFTSGGTFTLSGTGPFNGNFRPNTNATIVVTGSYPSGRPQLNGLGAVLRGTGSVQGFLAGAGSIVEPGVGAGTGILTVGSPIFSGTTFNVKLNGPTAGFNYDQVVSTSSLQFAGSPVLNVAMGYTPPAATVFTIISSNIAANGIFSGLPEGTIFVAGGVNLAISYVGGGSNVTLTVVDVPDPPTGVTANEVTTGNISVAFVPPAFNGGSVVLDYTATCGTQTTTGAGSPLVVTGVIAGITTCTVTARNAIGSSVPSAPATIVRLVPPPPPPPPPAPTPQVSTTPAYQALYWAGAAESGWGINLTHQGNIIFATWFTYDASGNGVWFVMSDTERTGPGVYAGKIYTTRGPAFNAVPFDSRQVQVTEVGTGTFTFTSATAGSFTYTVNGITQTKPLTRQEFGNAIPDCVAGGAAGTIVNYQDLWWNPSEAGWGLNLTHQGDVIFATWFTYDTTGKAQWLVMSNVHRVGFSDQFTGKIYRTQGNAFNTVPWNTGSIQVTEVGTVTLSFTDRDHGSFAYTLDGVSQVKAITRQIYADPKAQCRFR